MAFGLACEEADLTRERFARAVLALPAPWDEATPLPPAVRQLCRAITRDPSLAYYLACLAALEADDHDAIPRRRWQGSAAPDADAPSVPPVWRDADGATDGGEA